MSHSDLPRVPEVKVQVQVEVPTHSASSSSEVTSGATIVSHLSLPGMGAGVCVCCVLCHACRRRVSSCPLCCKSYTQAERQAAPGPGSLVYVYVSLSVLCPLFPYVYMFLVRSLLGFSHLILIWL